ncbi:MAG: acid-shock protein [Rhizobiaceae bacterium]
MKKTTTIALAFATLAGLAGSSAVAQERQGWRHDGGQRFERADADNSGDLTFEEFSAAFNERLDGMDADGDGTMTVEEIAAEVMQRRAERMAKRIISRYDTDGDGKLTVAEIESHQKKLFALLDGNDDGKLEKEEARRNGFERHHGRRDGKGHYRRY